MRALTRSRDAQAGLVTAVLGVIYLVAALQIEQDPSRASVLGPRVAPLLIGAATVACAIALVIQGLRGATATDEGEHPATDVVRETTAANEDRHPKSRRAVVVTFVLFAVYIVAFIPLGYLLSTFGFLVALTSYHDRGRLVRNCVFAGVFTPGVYLLFNYGLRVQLPPGLLG